MKLNKMSIPRDFIFNKEAIISYWENLQQFEGKLISQGRIARILKEKHPDKDFYNSMDRKFATLKFYGFVHYEDGKFKINPNYEKYVNSLKSNIDIISNFLEVLKTSKHKYYGDSSINFFELVITLLQDENILYLDHIDVITYLQHFNRINNVDELTSLIKKNRLLNFSEKVEVLENFYRDHDLGNLATPVHDAKTYLFSFLESNGFYTVKNSLQSKEYFQGSTKRKLEDRRLYLSEELLSLVNGYDYESITDDIEYNAVIETGSYDKANLEEIRLVDQSEETVKSISRRYKTDKKLRNTALERTSHTCEIALLKGEVHSTFIARFNNRDYAEVHHLVPMHAQENDSFVEDDKLISLDQIPNLVVLCPTCHRKIHYGQHPDVKHDLELLYDTRKEDLKNYNLNIEKEQLFGFYKIT
jgi:hypothetical protein